jgi:hypothetical protein
MPLMRAMARTAVIAGTATTVSNRVSRRQQGRWASQEQQQPAEQPQPRHTRRRRLPLLKQTRSNG